MTKTTKREMFEAIKSLAESGALHMADFNEAISDSAVAEFCRHEIELIDNKNAKAKERAATKTKEADELEAKVQAVLTDELTCIADITAKIDDPDVTVSKVQYRLNNLVKSGEARKDEITIPATENSKARRVVAFAKAC